jgi:serine/threonine protein kinase
MARTFQSDLLAGRYELVGSKPVDEGGMAEVWKARDHGRNPHRPDREVALKILKPYVAEDPSAVKRFEREGKEMIRFDHPNIARVFDRKQDGDVHFLVMEFIEGRSVSRLLRERNRPFAPADAVAIISQVCRALEYAHANRVIHRDIKPLNVMIEGDFEEGVVPTVKVTDFGIALAKQGTRLTRTGSVVGTVAYMPAEVIRGDEASEKSDTYACGVMLYQLLTGHVPFAGETLSAVLAEQEAGPPPSPASTSRGIPRGLSDVTLIAIALHPQARFESAADMRGATEASLAGEDLEAYLPTRLLRQETATPRTLYRASPPRRRPPSIYTPENPWPALFAYVAALSALVVMLIVTLRLTSAAAATPIWMLALAAGTGVVAFGLSRSPLFSADELRRDAARARLWQTLKRHFRSLIVLGLAILWGALGYYLATLLEVRISRQPAPSQRWLEVGCVVVWLVALGPLVWVARSRKTVGGVAGGGTLVVFLWVIAAIGLAEAPQALGPQWSRPALPLQVRAEGKEWVGMLRQPNRRIGRLPVGELRRRLADSRNSVLRGLRHADTTPQLRRAKRRAKRWMRSMRHARTLWHQPRCHTASARLRIDGGGARAICP